MGNFETVVSITNNLQQVLKEQGLKFDQETYEDITKIPVSLLPYGRIFYQGEVFDQEHGQRPSWNEIKYKIQVVIKNTNSRVIIREQQKWMHAIRDSITVNALNINDLVSSKLVSWVKSEEGDVDNQLDRSTIEYFMLIRYREL